MVSCVIEKVFAGDFYYSLQLPLIALCRNIKIYIVKCWHQSISEMKYKKRFWKLIENTGRIGEERSVIDMEENKMEIMNKSYTEPVVAEIRELIDNSRKKVATQVNNELLMTY